MIPKTVDIFHKYSLFTNLEKENIQNELQNRIMFMTKASIHIVFDSWETEANNLIKLQNSMP